MRQVQKASKTKINRPITAGNLEITRDFSDVRDVIGAYFALLDKGVSGEIYNVCNGLETPISRLLDVAKTHYGVKNRVEIDKKFIRPNEQLRAHGCNRKINQTYRLDIKN